MFDCASAALGPTGQHEVARPVNCGPIQKILSRSKLTNQPQVGQSGGVTAVDYLLNSV